MKKFNKAIQVSVEVDVIAEQLLSMMNVDEKHRELVVETIIGNMENTNRIGKLYNALNGHKDVINFEVGDKVICDAGLYVDGLYCKNVECEVVGIDMYDTNPIKVSYVSKTEKGTISTHPVPTNTCSKVPVKVDNIDLD